MNDRLLMAIILLAPAFIVGWTIGRGKLVSGLSNQAVELGILAFSTQFKKQILDYVNSSNVGDLE